jgi:hypothetical protein
MEGSGVGNKKKLASQSQGQGQDRGRALFESIGSKKVKRPFSGLVQGKVACDGYVFLVLQENIVPSFTA